MSNLRTDPARFEVVKNALCSAAEEMKIVLAKTAYSPLLKVAGDYSCGIFDIDGNMVAQGPDLPIHLGLDAGRGARGGAGVSRRRAGRCVHPQRSVSGRLASAGCERGRAGVLRRPAAGVRLRAGALAGHRQRHARKLRRRDGNLRRGSAPAADPAVSRRQARPGDRGDHLRQCPHPGGTAGRSARPGGGEPTGGGSGCRRWQRNMAPTRCWASCRRCWTTPKR